MDENQVVIDRLENIANQLGVKRRTVDKWREKEKWPLDRQDGRYTFYKIPVGFIEKKRQELSKISEQNTPSENDSRNNVRTIQEPIRDPNPLSENHTQNADPSMESLIATIHLQQKQLAEKDEQITSLNNQLSNAHGKLMLRKEEPDFKNALEDFENRLLQKLKPQKPWWQVW